MVLPFSFPKKIGARFRPPPRWCFARNVYVMPCQMHGPVTSYRLNATTLAPRPAWQRRLLIGWLERAALACGSKTKKMSRFIGRRRSTGCCPLDSQRLRPTSGVIRNFGTFYNLSASLSGNAAHAALWRAGLGEVFVRRVFVAFFIRHRDLRRVGRGCAKLAKALTQEIQHFCVGATSREFGTRD
jgi:hypothetical protein